MAWNEPSGKGNDKDPWGRKKNESGPPDLDEMLGNLNRRLGQVFGGGSSGSEDNNKGMTLVIGAIMLVVLLLWALAGIFIVDPAEEAVILRFGKYIDTVKPGPHWIPRIVDSRYLVNVKEVYNFTYSSEMLTADENIVSVSMAVQYKVADARDYLFNVVSPQNSIKEATASALRQVIGNTSLDQALTTGRELLADDVKKQLDDLLISYKTGLQVVSVNMLPIKPPEAVQSAFDDAIKAREDEQRYQKQAQAYSNNVTFSAQGQAKRMVREAEAYKKQVVLQAKANIASYLAILPEYERAPAVTRERMYYDAMSEVLANTSKVLMDVNKSNSLMYLPVDKLFNNAPMANISEPTQLAPTLAMPSLPSYTDPATSKQTLPAGMSSASDFRPSRTDMAFTSSNSQGEQ